MRVADALSQLECLINEVRYAESVASDLKSQLLTLPSELGQQISAECRHQLAMEIYWKCPDVPAAAVAALLGVKTGQLRGCLNSQVSGILCERCGALINARSRTELQELMRQARKNPMWAEGYRVVCSGCRDEILNERTEQVRTHHRKQAIRLEQLRTMPYAEYLQTEEWHCTRKAALRRARYRCQTCNASNVVLHVHHRTYERRGCELAGDLIALCRDCHELFHGVEA